MKKIFAILSLALVGLGIQEVSAQGVKVGVKAGYNGGSWEGDAMKSFDNVISLTNGYAGTAMRNGYHAGLYARFVVNPTFSIEPAIYYSQKGMVVTGEFSSEKFDFINLKATLTDKADYIDIPVTAKVFVADGLHFYGGPQVSFLVSNKINTRASVIGFNVLNKDFNYDSPFRKTDFGLVGGVGYQFTNGLNFSVGYDYGLNTVDKNGNFDTFNRVVKASVGFEF